MAVAVVEDNVVAPQPLAPSLRPVAADLKEEGFSRRRWFIRAKEGVTKDDVRYPSFFAALATRLARHDIVTVLGPNEDWELEVCVEGTSLTGAEVSIRKNHSRTPIRQSFEALDDQHHVEFKPGQGWCVIRRLPNREPEVFISGHGSSVGAKMEWVRRQPRPVV